jgi:hypothetical protein
MLIEKSNFNPGDIVAIKLMSGEEVIARLTEYTNDYVRVTNPVLMILEMVDDEVRHPVTGEVHKNQQALVAFAPFMLGLPDNETVRIGTAKYITIVKARDDAASQYKNAIGTQVQEKVGTSSGHGIGGFGGTRF